MNALIHSQAADQPAYKELQKELMVRGISFKTGIELGSAEARRQAQAYDLLIVQFAKRASHANLTNGISAVMQAFMDCGKPVIVVVPQNWTSAHSPTPQLVSYDVGRAWSSSSLGTVEYSHHTIGRWIEVLQSRHSTASAPPPQPQPASLPQAATPVSRPSSPCSIVTVEDATCEAPQDGLPRGVTTAALAAGVRPSA